MELSPRLTRWQSLFSLLLLLNLGASSSIVNMRRITHPTVQQTLAGRAVLPCVFTLQAGASSQPPHLLWTRISPPAGGQGAPLEQMVLSAKGDVIKVNKAFAGRITLPGYAANPLNATMEISSLRTNDSGTYHCQVVMGNDYERDAVPLVVSGVVFHYQAPGARYVLSFADAQRVCQENSAQIASAAQLWAAYYDGFASCAAGWLDDQTVRYSVQLPELGCYGHKEYSAGVRNYGKRDPKELFDVYCFAKELDGEVFHSSVPGRLSLSSASDRCVSLGGQLATVGQLYLAWRAGLDSCAPGWLSDGSVRYPVTWPGPDCGGNRPGVRTVTPNSTADNGTALYDAYCYRGKLKDADSISQIYTSLWKPWSYLTGSTDADSTGTQLTTQHAATTAGSSGGSDVSPSNWTGLVDLEEEDVLHSLDESTDRWSSDFSGSYVTLRLIPGQSSLEWEDPLEPGPDSEEFLRPPVYPTATEKKVISKIIKSMWKPWNYLVGTGSEAGTQGPSGEPGNDEAATKKDDKELDPSKTESPSAMPSAGSFPWGGPWVSRPTKENTPPATEVSPTHPASTLVPSTVPVTTESSKTWETSNTHMSTTSNPAPEIISSSGDAWVRVEAETTTQLGDRRQEAVTSRAGRGRGRGKKNRGEDRGRAEEREKKEDEGSGEVTGAEAKGEIQVSRRLVGTSKPRERSRERSRERGHRKGQTTTTAATTTPTSAVEPTAVATTVKATLPPETKSQAITLDLQETPSASPSPSSLTTLDHNGTLTLSPSSSPSDSSDLHGQTNTLSPSPSHSPSPPVPADLNETPSPTPSTSPAPSLSAELDLHETLSVSKSPSPSISADIYETPTKSLLPSMPAETPPDSPSPSASSVPTVSAPVATTSQPSPSQSLLESQTPSPSPALLPSSPTSTHAHPSPSSPSHTTSSSPSPPPTHPPTQGEAVVSEDPSQSPHADGEDSSTPLLASLPSAPVEKAAVNVSLDYPSLLSGPPEEEEPTWSHAVGSGAMLPGNIEEESSRGSNISTGTLGPLVEVEPCVTNPCLHGGKCLPQGTGYSCYCPQGYAGENCEIDVDDCQSEPCENGGTCIDKIDSFLCLCLPSYGGDACEKDVEGCEHGWKKFHGHCYRYFTHRHTWEDAEKDCREHSAHLSSIVSANEQEFINGLGHDNAWIGLNDRTVEEDFQWTDGNEQVYENWRESQPDNFFAGGEDCVLTIAHEDGKWNDVPCNYNLPYICKKGTVLCGTPPAVDNAHLVGRRRSHYDIHSVVRYQCSEGFYQRHIPTTRCRADGSWERPRIICTKTRRSHRYRRHHHNQRRERRSHRRRGGDGHRAREDAHSYY
ncbi:neurocan core protein-like [Betta splendens]|uniref:Neurocan core protein-like n=1 Tax=Betta splendens TaxID=158456 RepID=A0A6P7KX69_BETSP|nr:neurocan core protein-like [Betta splendens]